MFVCKGAITLVAINWLTRCSLALMIDQNVPFQMGISGEGFVTFVTLKWPVSRVREEMSLESRWSGKGCRAARLCALVRPLTLSSSHGTTVVHRLYFRPFQHHVVNIREPHNALLNLASRSPKVLYYNQITVPVSPDKLSSQCVSFRCDHLSLPSAQNLNCLKETKS